MPATRFVYVDESKVAPFRLAATVVPAQHVATVRHELQALLLPNQQRLHFKSERDQRRRSHLKCMATMPAEVWLYEVATVVGGEIAQRSACLTALVEDLASRNENVRLFIENDQSIVHHDRSTMFEALNKHATYQQVTYCHVPAKDEPALWISDAVAWAWPKGGAWRELARPIVLNVRKL